MAVNNGEIGVRIADAAQINDAANALRRTVGAPLAGVPGGRDVTVSTADNQRLRIAFVQEAFDAEASKAVEQNIEVIRRRIDQMGTKEPDIARRGKNRIDIQAAGESDPEKLKNIIGQTVKYDFPDGRRDGVAGRSIAAGRIPPGDEILASPPVRHCALSYVGQEALCWSPARC